MMSSPVIGFRIWVLALSVLGGGRYGGSPPSPKEDFKAFDFNLLVFRYVFLTLTRPMMYFL